MRRHLPFVVVFAQVGCLCSGLGLEHDLRTVEVAAAVDAGRTADAGPSPDAGAGVVDAGVRDAGFVPRPCIAGTFTVFPAEPVVMLVLDRSSSMAVAISPTQSRWEAVISSLVATLPGQDATMQVGGIAFPNLAQGAGSCQGGEVIPPQRNNARRFLSSVTNRQPEGETPTAAAVLVATEELKRRRASNVARAMVLATDGEPGCTPNPLAVVNSQLERAAAAGVPTWVVGLTGDAGDEAALNEMARAGSRPLSGARAFYAAQSAAELELAFGSIRDQVRSCSFLTESVPDRDGGIIISFAGTEVPLADDAGVNGWRWTDRENGEFALLGSVCAQAIRSPSSAVVTVTCGR